MLRALEPEMDLVRSDRAVRVEAPGNRALDTGPRVCGNRFEGRSPVAWCRACGGKAPEHCPEPGNDIVAMSLGKRRDGVAQQVEQVLESAPKHG